MFSARCWDGSSDGAGKKRGDTAPGDWSCRPGDDRCRDRGGNRVAEEKRERVERVRDRACGSCSLCCKLVAVGKKDESFQKPQGVWCEHCAKPRCRVYETRPNACREYKCLWLRGLFAEEDRPDRAGLVVHLEQSIGDHVWDPAGILQFLETLTTLVDGTWQGPWAVCIIPPKPGQRWMRIPGKTQGYVPLLQESPTNPAPRIEP